MKWLVSSKQEKNPSEDSKMIVKKKNKFFVKSKKGKNLGGPYANKKMALKRLRQVEYFKRKNP